MNRAGTNLALYGCFTLAFVCTLYAVSGISMEKAIDVAAAQGADAETDGPSDTNPSDTTYYPLPSLALKTGASDPVYRAVRLSLSRNPAAGLVTRSEPKATPVRSDGARLERLVAGARSVAASMGVVAPSVQSHAPPFPLRA